MKLSDQSSLHTNFKMYTPPTSLSSSLSLFIDSLSHPAPGLGQSPVKLLSNIRILYCQYFH